MFTNNTGTRSFTYINHIFTNAVKLCSKAISVSIGCSDHNIVAISRKAKVPTAGPKIVYKRSYKRFCCDSYVDDVKNICWSDVIKEEHPDAALDEFMKLLLPIIDKPIPVKKLTVRTVKALLYLSLNQMAYSSSSNVSNYFNDYFIGKVGKLRQEMQTTISERHIPA